ncbi:unnamed protein product [Rhodiola kirilowii]
MGLSLLEILATSYLVGQALFIPPTLLYFYCKEKRMDAEIQQELDEIYKKYRK